MKKLFASTYERYKSILVELSKETKDIDCCKKCNISPNSYGGLMCALRKRGIDIKRAKGRYILRTKLKDAIKKLGDVSVSIKTIEVKKKKTKPGINEKEYTIIGGHEWFGILTKRVTIDCRIPVKSK